MVLLSAITLVLSTILCIHSLSGRGVVGCTAGTGCNEVLGSRWSFLFGMIPVSGIAVICYAALTFCLLFRRTVDDDPQFARWVDLGTLMFAGTIIGAALWFIWLQKNMIRAFCPYCMTAHICGIILSLMLLIRTHVRFLWRILCLLAGISLAAGLAGIQLLTTPRSAYDRGFIPEALPLTNPDEMPVIGDPSSAGKTITLLYDYRCSHCQRIHSLLGEVVREMDGDIAFVLAPVPLSSACNPYIPAGEDRFRGSCELTRYALALWRCDRGAFSIFDAWLFETAPGTLWHPREPEEAFAKACTLVDEQAFREALEDPWIRDYLLKVYELFGRTSSSEKAAIPRFVCDETYLVPDADDTEGLVSILRSVFLN